MAECSVEGCSNHANRVSYVLCEKHYGRLRRHGSTDLAQRYKDGKLEHSGGYLLVYAPDHPVATFSRAYEHRVVYYDNYGEGPFECHHCGTEVSWDTLHIDHLDDNKKNNDISNLVASCPTCNQARGRHKMVKSQRSKGINIEFNGVTKHVSEWANDLGISRTSLVSRLKKWPKERALTEPRGKFGPK